MAPFSIILVGEFFVTIYKYSLLYSLNRNLMSSFVIFIAFRVILIHRWHLIGPCGTERVAVHHFADEGVVLLAVRGVLK